MRRKKYAFFIAIVFMCLGLGYAFLNTTLVFKGTTHVKSNSWNVYWDNLIVMPGSVTGDQVLSPPSISGNTISFQVDLKEPGEYYEFIVNAINDGSIDAMVEGINKSVAGSNDIPSYLTYEVSYYDDLSVERGHLLAAGAQEVYKIRIEYKEYVSPSELSPGNHYFPISFRVNFIQSDSSAQSVPNRVYTRSEGVYTKGGNINNLSGEFYDNYLDALASYNIPVFVDIVHNNNSIIRTYVGFVQHNRLYYLMGGTDNNMRDKEIMSHAFGTNNYSESSDENTDIYAFADCESKLAGAIDYEHSHYSSTHVGIMGDDLDGSVPIFGCFITKNPANYTLCAYDEWDSVIADPIFYDICPA